MGRIDYDEVRRLVCRYNPKIIVAGASAYPALLILGPLRNCPGGGSYLTPMAHIVGLVATGLHLSPCSVADFVTTTTHPPCGDPGRMIFCKGCCRN